MEPILEKLKPAPVPDWTNRILCEWGHHDGLPYLKNSQVRVCDVLAAIRDGRDLSAASRTFPTVTAPDTLACLSYAETICSHAVARLGIIRFCTPGINWEDTTWEGKPVIAGTSHLVAKILFALAHTLTYEEILGEMPGLKAENIDTALALAVEVSQISSLFDLAYLAVVNGGFYIAPPQGEGAS